MMYTFFDRQNKKYKYSLLLFQVFPSEKLYCNHNHHRICMDSLLGLSELILTFQMLSRRRLDNNKWTTDMEIFWIEKSGFDVKKNSKSGKSNSNLS